MTAPNRMLAPMFGYGVALAVIALLLDWLDYGQAMRLHSRDMAMVLTAALFAVLGVWVGNRLTRRQAPPNFARNEDAIGSLGLSKREVEVLEQIAAGHANKVIARRLAISPNTVKTHIARLFEKLDATSRTQAVQAARALEILP